MSLRLKLFTLNSWGLPFPIVCKNRNERICAIGDFLLKSDFDIVVLEEIWVKSDFQTLKQKLQKNLPYSHYFYSGAIGSGLCVFSKYLIAETSYHRYHLNGHAHKIFHGDWFGGKGVGLCKIHVEQCSLDINFYCTHFHAEYNPDKDEYEAHRLAQAFELSQFIRNTFHGCDMAILAGDLNITPSTLGYQIITHHGHMRDTWTEKQNTVVNEAMGTCDVPGNTYTEKSGQNGERIDYILFRPKNYIKVEVAECNIGIGKIPSANLSFSDHEAVMASLSITRTNDQHVKGNRHELSERVQENLHESLIVIDKGKIQCKSEERFFQIVVVLLSLVLYILNNYINMSDYNEGVVLSVTLATTKLLLALGIGFSVWTALIVKRAELHGLEACKEDIKKLLQL
ncbi:putative neutral sphingomyelinase [Physella acuta]|uniref:putative neutral sphingomyelinase n=1 Tax=Physella acuta TaxID=109671 RepID=UPI0027DC126C|nr:putative neutral sphingomyelinase [Physella acuta]